MQLKIPTIFNEEIGITGSPDFFLKRHGSNGTLNKVKPEDSAAHNWYRFVLSYPPHLVRDYLEKFGANGANVVLDPFCGTGTTIVESKKNGLTAIGIEPNPVPHFASTTKTQWGIDAGKFFEHAQSIAAIYSKRIKESERQLLDPEKEKLLLKNSISPEPLHKFLILQQIIREQEKTPYFDYELLALAKALVFSISNLHFGPEVGVRNIKQDADVIGSWFKEITIMRDDIQELSHLNHPFTTIHRADARSLNHLLSPNSIDIVITSPPYPNEKDYTRTTRLESVLLGFINNKEGLREIKRSLVRSNTRGIYVIDNDDNWVRDNVEINRIAFEIEKRRIDLGKTSGFERNYARVTKLYFGGMVRHLAELRSKLKPGAMLAYVVGDQASYLQVMIRTGQILADIAESLGYEVVSIDLFRTRIATATREQLREEILVLRWPQK